MNRRKIAVITGSRAEYGLLYWIIKGIDDDPALKLQLIVTGMHLSSKFGLTVKEIEKDGFPIAARIKMLVSSDTEEAIATSVGRGMTGFAKAYSRLRPDMIVVLGDRFEIFAAVSAAIPFRIPVVHIFGGEATAGAFDEQFRNAITKMSHIHFPSTEEYKNRIIQMGENPKYVFSFGAPGIDNVLKLKFLDYEKLCSELRIPVNRRIGVITYHPVTLEDNTAGKQISELLAALNKIEDIHWVFTFPNADTDNEVIIKEIKRYIKKYPAKSRLYISLGRLRYLSLLKNASVLVGNSSSGLIEAPTFHLPVVNIGDRQKGRIKLANVIDVKECTREAIFKAVSKALSVGFRKSLEHLRNPYGKGNASEKIVEVLKCIPINGSLIKKEFHKLERRNY